MTIAVITANMGSFDKELQPVPQSLPFDFYRFTDKNFPRRECAMTPRLQARIAKMFGWQMVPEHDIYIWADSSVVFSHVDTIKWLIGHCGASDVCVFTHPDRKTVKEEADYLKKRLAKKCPYITPRYKNELIDEQLKEIDPSGPLFASTVIVYKNNKIVKRMMKEWWYHTSRYHIIDQLSLFHSMTTTGCSWSVIDIPYLKNQYLTYTRK